MPTLEWIGKDKVVNHHQEVPYRVLERQYSYDGAGQRRGQRQRKHDYPRRQSGGTEGPAAQVRGKGKVHLH